MQFQPFFLWTYLKFLPAMARGAEDVRGGVVEDLRRVLARTWERGEGGSVAKGLGEVIFGGSLVGCCRRCSSEVCQNEWAPLTLWSLTETLFIFEILANDGWNIFSFFHRDEIFQKRFLLEGVLFMWSVAMLFLFSLTHTFRSRKSDHFMSSVDLNKFLQRP